MRARPAMSAALDPVPGACLAVSHDGGTRADTLAARGGRAGRERTPSRSRPARAAASPARPSTCSSPRATDDSWCHTVAYTSALAAGAAIAGRLGPGARRRPRHAGFSSVPRARAGGALDRRTASPTAASCSAPEPRRPHTARELALKIAEGARLPTLALELETVLHGQLAGHEPADALVLVAITDHPERERHPAARRTSPAPPPRSACLSPAALRRLRPRAGRRTDARRTARHRARRPRPPRPPARRAARRRGRAADAHPRAGTRSPPTPT